LRTDVYQRIAQSSIIFLLMSGSKVPSELADAIIDQLCEDKATLAKCSTVCKAWLARSRHYHFEHITLSYQDRARNIAFIALCNSSLSTITPYIRSLRLEEGRAPFQRWIIEILPKLMVFSAVQSLTVENTTFPLDSPLMTTLFSSFPMLTKLSLVWAYFRSFAQIISVICACPLLEHLSLDGIHYWNTVHQSVPSIDQYPLRCL